MEVWVPWLATLLFGYFAIISLYAGLKSYKEVPVNRFSYNRYFNRLFNDWTDLFVLVLIL